MLTPELNADLDRMRILSALLDNSTATEDEHKEWHSLLEKTAKEIQPLMKKIVQAGLLNMIVGGDNEFVDPEVNAMIYSVKHVFNDGGHLLLDGELFDVVFDEEDDEDEDEDDFDDDDFDDDDDGDVDDPAPSNFDMLQPSMN